MDSKKVRVACYARYSTNMQREESIFAQMRAMKKYCEDKGWVIVKKYVDEAFSATTDKRPQFQQMIADSSNKEFEIVLVHKLDRFARIVNLLENGTSSPIKIFHGSVVVVTVR